MVSNPHETIVLLTSAPNEMEAGIIVGTLEERGLRSTVSGVYTSGFRAEAPGWVQILVSEQDLPAAQAVLDEMHGGGEEIDWSKVDVGEPEGE